jgi:hypothetical protein
MTLRGATATQVTEAIWTGHWKPGRRGKSQVYKAFAFGRPSPVNQKVYVLKTIHDIFSNEPTEIVVITVLVYYSDEEPTS